MFTSPTALLWKSTKIYTNHGFWMFLRCVWSASMACFHVTFWARWCHGEVKHHSFPKIFQNLLPMGTDPVRSQGFCGFFFILGGGNSKLPGLIYTFDSPFLWCIGIETTAFCAKMKSHDSGTHLLHCPSWTFRPALGLDTASLFWN